MLRRLLTTLFFVGAVVGLTSGANAQYMKIVTDNPTDNTRLRATGTTQLTVQLNTNHDRDNSLQTCNSHSAANCGGTASPNPLTLFSYQVYLRAIGGTVTWGSFTPDTSSFTPLQPTVSDATDVEFTYARPPGTSSPAGFSSIGKINVTIVTGSPSISIVKFPENTTGTIDPSSFGTSFGTNCDGFVIGNTYILGDAADPCGNVSGLPADWYDADGAGAPASANAQPQITAPPTASGAEGTAIPVITANATDADAANTLTITQTGKPASLVFTHTPGISPRTATISGTPGFNDAGTYSIVWTVNDGSGAGNATNSATTTLTISNTNRAPVLTQPANMTVAEGATANQAITATDADGQALSFAKVSGPTYATVTTTTPGTGTGTGNINLAPGFSDAGTATLTASASDGSLSDSKTITVTVTNTNRAPVLAQPANMTVAEGATANQVITATDADGQSITFAKVSGATFATVTTTTPGTGTGTGNINLAPGFSDAGTSTLVVSASDGTASDSKTITVTVTNTDRAVVLTPLTNMTVQAGTTANQAFSASDADGDAITFASTGPAFLSRTDNAQVTTTRTGNINLAPPLGTSPGTFAASVTASANGTTSPSNYTITVTAGANQAPVLAQPANMTVNEGATANQTITATDADGQALTFSKVSGPTYLTVTTTTPGTGTGTGNINLAPGFSDAGTATAVVRASDGSANSDRTITVTVNNVNRNPVLAQPANMTVNEGATANQVITATDADGQAITFAKVSGAAFATVTTTTPGTGTGTGNINLAPGFSDAGTSTLVVSASDGTASDSKTITVTVNNVNRAPVLAQPANMTVNEGATANQAITATDADGQALTFAKVSGAAFATVTTTTPGTGTGTGNINLAPGFSDAGTSTLVVSASDGTASDSKTITVTVNNVNRNPVLAQPANMTVAEGATANQVITATDADGQALTFAKVSGATFATVTTTTPGTGTGTGNINLAPGFSDAGTSTLVVSASDGTASDSKTITVTVNNTDRAVVLTPLTNMTVQAGTTANQAFSATDPDGDAITFASTGPAFLTRTDNAQVGNTRTGNINLAPPLGTSPGTFAASVTASANGTTSPSNYTITVTAGANQAPVLAQPANMTVNEGATANQTITATDADGQALTFSKVSGPAYLTVTTTTPGTGTGTGNINLAPGFSDAGTATAVVRASDGSANSDRTITVTVNNVNQAPVLAQPANMTVNEGATANQAITATDADGQALTFAKVSGATFATVTTTTPGTGTGTGNINLAPGFSDAGTSTLVVSASDGTASDSKTITVTVNNVNRAPVLAQPANMTVAEGATANQAITATDADGQSITFAKVSGATFATVTTTTPGTGTGTGNINLAPGFSDAGTSTLVVSASDGTASDSKTITVTVNNTDRAVVLTPLGAMTVQAGTTANQAFSATDPDGDAITFASTGPAFLTRTDNAQVGNTRTGNINLAPPLGTSPGTFAASVTASANGTTSPSNYTITVTAGANQAPVLAQPANMTVNEGATANQTITATDADGNALTFSKVSGPTYLTVTTTTPGTGTGTGNINLAPGFSDAGTATAVVRASDGSANSDRTITVTVNNVNRAPVLAQPANMTVDEGVTANQVITATDADGQAITFAKVSGAAFATVTTTTPGTGTGTGNINLAPGFSDAGTSTLVVSASDGTASDSKTITVTVNNVNRAPVLAQPANMTVNEGATANQAITATDADGQALTFAKVSGAAFATVTTTTPGTGTGTGNINLAPGFSDAGTSTLVVSASDGTASDSKTITVTVNNVNRAPVLAQPANMTVAEGATANQVITATDADGQALTFAKVSGATFATVTTTTPGTGTGTGNINLAPGFSDAGTSTLVVSASDGTASDSKTITVTVTNTDRAVVLTPLTNMSVQAGTTANQAFSATDPDGDAITFASTGPAFLTRTDNAQVGNTRTGNINLAPPLGTSPGTFAASVTASANGTTSPSNFTITVTAGANQAPVLAQPANMTVNEGATANQTITATDADGNALTFSKVSGPAYLTVTTTTPGTGTGTGNINLAPGFTDAGTATAVVRASDGSANSDRTITVTVNNVNRAPVLAQPANQSVAQGGTSDQVITATDADGQALTFAKVTGPTFMTVTTTSPGTGTGTGNIHLAAAAGEVTGTYSASVSASDGTASDTKSLTITVTPTNRAPVLAQPANMTVNEGATANQTLNATDPDGNSLTFSKASGPAYATVTTTTPGSGTATGNLNLAPGFSDAGTATVSVSVSDGSLSDSKTLTVTVNNVNQAPVLAQPANMTVAEGATANQSITATDADGQALSFAKVSGAAFATVTTTTPGTGTGTGNINLAPGFSDAGTSTLVVSASDGTASDSKTITVTVTNTNRAPVLAQPANMTVAEGATANQTITATDADGQALTFAKVSGAAFATVTTTTPGTGTGTGNINLAPGFSDAGTSTLVVSASDGTASDSKTITVTVTNVNRAPTLNQPTNMTVAQGFTSDQIIIGSDPDGDALTFAKVTGPAFMTVTTTNATTGNIHLAAGASEPLGTSSASVSASDGVASDTKSFQITVTPTNHAPVLAQPANMTVNEGATANQTLNATDSDGNALTFTKASGPAYATVTTTSPGTGVATGNLNLAPGFSDAGTASITVSVSDGSMSDSKSLTVTVNNVNRAPVLTQPANMTVAEGATANQVLTASDADGDALTFAKVSGPAFATVTTTTATTGNINLAPGFTDAGTYTATVSASDGSASDSKSLTITVTNTDRAVVLNAIANMSVAVGATADQAFSATDADGDAISFTSTGPAFLTRTDNAQVGNTRTGNIHLAPPLGTATGTYAASVTASANGTTSPRNFTVTVTAGANQAPTLAQPANMTVNEGQTADQTLTGSDPDGDALTFSKVSGPLFLTVTTTTATTGNAHLAPGFSDAGSYPATVRASDASTGDNKSFTITVNNVNRAPTADAGGPYSGTVGIPVHFDGTGSSDPDGDVLTYAWDFGDGLNGTGSTVDHNYAATGTYTATLTVTDNGTPALNDSDTADVTISDELAALVFKSTNGDWKLGKSNKPRYCLQIEPIDASYANSDVILSSIVIKYNGHTGSAEIGKTSIDADHNFNGINEIQACFTIATLRSVFAGLPGGATTVTAVVEGNLVTGGKFAGSVEITIRGPVTGSGFAAASVSPNPLNPSATLSFETSKPGSVRVEMFDPQGRLVRTILNEYVGAGVHETKIDGRGQSGEKLASGIYFIRGVTADGTFKNTITILK